MGKPNKKLKKIFIIMGMTGAVYGSFRFLLPLVIPFLLSWGIAAALRPSARWLQERCRLCFRGREYKIPLGAAGVLELLAVLAVLGFAVYSGGQKLCREMALLLSAAPGWIEKLDVWLTAVCHSMEEILCLKSNVLVFLMRRMLRGLLTVVTDGAVPYLMSNSLLMLKLGIGCSVCLLLLLVSTGLCLQEMDAWKVRMEKSMFYREYEIIVRRLSGTVSAWLKTQGVILVLTASVCTAGLWLMKNPYYFLLGTGIGLLDALPVLGTGTVLIPWALINFFMGKWKGGLALLVLYGICYLLREFLEARMMGSQVGLSPLGNLMAMYVGLELFGIAGFFLGPLGLLLIEDLTEAAYRDS